MEIIGSATKKGRKNARFSGLVDGVRGEDLFIRIRPLRYLIGSHGKEPSAMLGAHVMCTAGLLLALYSPGGAE